MKLLIEHGRVIDPASGRVFKPSLIREIGGHRVAVIGQAFPYVPIAHPKRFTPDWTFGIRDEELQKLVNATAFIKGDGRLVPLDHDLMALTGIHHFEVADAPLGAGRQCREERIELPLQSMDARLVEARPIKPP